MANIQFDNIEIVDAMYCPNNGPYSRPTLQLTITFDEKLSANEKTKLKKLLYSQNESPDIKMAIGLQTYIPGARIESRVSRNSGRYPWDSTDRIDSVSKAYESIVRALAIDHIFYDDIATVVFWKDGTKTIVKCPEGTPYDEYTAFCAAVAKKFYGTNSAIKRVIKKKARYSKKRKIAMLFDENIPEDTIRNIFLPQNKNSKLQHKANRVIGKVASVNETDKGLEVEVTKND